ncbi:TPA: hypothetical protein HA246_04570 [Candidatus Woesearchaeota archaeon]|nr:hypothetical protein [Candidatus Woesearchaeota archaeon]
MGTAEAVSGLELKVLDITNDAEVRAAAELTYENWGKIIKYERRGGKSKRLESIAGQLRARSEKFRDGQIVAYYEGKLVGIINANRLSINSWQEIPKTWKAATGNYVFDNYDSNGNVLVCPNVSVNLTEEYSKRNIGSHLINAVRELALKINRDNVNSGHQDIEAIMPYSRFRHYKATKEAVKEGKTLVVNINGKYYVLDESHLKDEELRRKLSKQGVAVLPIKEFTPQNYIFFRRFKDLASAEQEEAVDVPYDDVPRFHSRLGGVPIGIEKKKFDLLISGLGYGGRPADKESGGHNPILLYDLTRKKIMFDRLVSPDHNGHFSKAKDGIGRGLYKYNRTA